MWSADLLNAVARRWVEVAWTVVWQSTVPAAIVALIVLAFRRSSPEVRYWLWQIVAIKLLLMPFWTVPVAVPTGSEEHADARMAIELGDAVISEVKPKDANAEHGANDGAEKSPSEPQGGTRAQEASRSGRGLTLPSSTTTIEISEHSHAPAVLRRHHAPTASSSRSAPPLIAQIRWQAWLAIAWAVIVAAQIAGMLIQRIRLRRLLSSAHPASPQLAALVAEMAAALGLSRAPRTVLIDRDGSPFACGVLRPVVVLPAAIRIALDEGQLRQVLLHELAHIKRRDLLWGWIPELARMLYFFHPAAHWVCFRIRLERELACDRLAMAASGADAYEYAETLVRAVSFNARPFVLRDGAVHCGCSSQLSPLWKRRISMLPLTRRCRAPRLRSWVTLAMTGIVIAAMPTLLAVSVAAQPSAPIVPEPEASGAEEVPVVPETNPEPPTAPASGRANNQPQVADPGAQRALSAEEVPAEFRKHPPSQTRTEMPSWPAPAGSGPFMDIITLANGYMEALGGIRTGEIEFQLKQDLFKKNATSTLDVARARAELENARMRAELSRRIAELAKRNTQRELQWLDQQRRIYEARKEAGAPTYDPANMLALERDRDLAQGRLEMLEAILSLQH